MRFSPVSVDLAVAHRVPSRSAVTGLAWGGRPVHSCGTMSSQRPPAWLNALLLKSLIIVPLILCSVREVLWDNGACV